MSLSDELKAKIDTEIGILTDSVMTGLLTIDQYKFKTGKAAGLALSREFLNEVLEAALRDNEDDII